MTEKNRLRAADYHGVDYFYYARDAKDADRSIETPLQSEHIEDGPRFRLSRILGLWKMYIVSADVHMSVPQLTAQLEALTQTTEMELRMLADREIAQETVAERIRVCLLLEAALATSPAYASVLFGPWIWRDRPTLSTAASPESTEEPV